MDKKKKIQLDEVQIWLGSEDARMNQLIYDLELNFLFGQESIECAGIPDAYDELIPDNLDETARAKWLFDYVERQPERFIAINIDYNGYDTMVRFIETIEDDNLAELLSMAIHGRGAFRRFTDAVARHGLSQTWYAFRDAAEKQAIRDWCAAKGYECI